MTWQGLVNQAITRTTGYMIVRAENVPRPPSPAERKAAAEKVAARRAKARKVAERKAAAAKAAAKTRQITVATRSEIRPPAYPETDRLVQRPVFVFAPVRSGSTLLRLMLNAHSAVHSPHEMHLRRLRVTEVTELSGKAMELLGYNEADLEHLLWDRVLHRELTRSGKSIVVDKTPSNSFVHQRIATAWPHARFVFLIRHPASIAASWSEASAGRRTREEAIDDCLSYMLATERARENLTGLTVRYEELTTEPEKVTREICDFLDVPWEPAILEYGADNSFVKGVGDWTEKVRTGSVQQGRPVVADHEVPEQLVEMCRTWGYLPAEQPAPPAPPA